MTSAIADSWQPYAWKYRVLIVYAPTDNTAELTAQRALLAGLEGEFSERDVVLIEVVGNHIKTKIGPQSEMIAAQLRSRHAIGVRQFQIVLVGKDTGVKLRSETPVAAADIFSLIDAMPMRRREMHLLKAIP